MNRFGSKRTFAALLLGASAFFGKGEATAAPYIGQWQSFYGGIFTVLGWRASATFDVPDACLALGNASIAPVVTGPCAGFTVPAAQVELYSVADPVAILGTYMLNTNVIVAGIDIAASALAGVNTGFFDRFVPSLAVAGGGAYSFSLILTDGPQAQLVYATPIATSPSCAFLPVSGTDCGFSANPALGVFTAVATPISEPATWAMMLTGLIGIGAMAWRRMPRGAR